MKAIPPDAVKFTKFSFFQSFEADAKLSDEVPAERRVWGRTCEPEQHLNRRVAPRAECRRRRVAMDREAHRGSEHRRAPRTGALGLPGGGGTALLHGRRGRGPPARRHAPALGRPVVGLRYESDAEITEQRPDERVAWRNTDGKDNAGVVTFHRLDDDATRVMVPLDFVLEGVKEKIGHALGAPDRRVQGDLSASRI
jgi:hypothetical protein